MIVTINSEKYVLDFEYQKQRRDKTEILTDSEGGKHVVFLETDQQRYNNKCRKTTCRLKKIISMNPFKTKLIVQSSVTCLPGDQFNKKIGRELVLKKLSKMLCREENNAIWKAYLNRKNRTPVQA